MRLRDGQRLRRRSPEGSDTGGVALGRRSRRKRYIMCASNDAPLDVEYLLASCLTVLSRSLFRFLQFSSIQTACVVRHCSQATRLYPEARHSVTCNIVMRPLHRSLIFTPTPWTANAIARRSFTRSAVRHQNPPPDPAARSFFKIFRRLSVVLSTFLGFGLIFSYAPPFRTTTKEGRAFDQYLQSQ